MKAESGSTEQTPVDLLIIGGGINGCGIARDAAGRGLSVILCEQGDLAQATSSASTKLFHGGLRYLEYYEFRLVREALREREVLLRAMPHIAWPMRFVLPHHKGLRPAWLLRLGLFIYDHLGGRKILPATQAVDLTKSDLGKPLKASFRRGFEYSDCWVDDARLVVLNACDARGRCAEILTRTRCETAERTNGLWRVGLKDQISGDMRMVFARGLVNAGGPWVEDVIHSSLRQNSSDKIRLVRGSHIVTRKVFDHDRAYIFQNADGRVLFAIPYEQDFTLIGTTDRDHTAAPGEAACTDEEAEYLCNAASAYFEKAIQTSDIVHTYSGVRPLYDDGASSATAATRDYVLKIETLESEAPLLNIFGGKITTYRRLAEAALEKLAPFFPTMREKWTQTAPLPGGDFPVDGFEALVASLIGVYPFLSEDWARRLVRSYGSHANDLLGDARTLADMGIDFGATLTSREVDWLVSREWAQTTDDVLWRRTKLGLRREQIDLAALADHLGAPAPRQESATSQRASAG